MHIIGAGGHAKVVLDTSLETGRTIHGVWDDDLTCKEVLGHIIKGCISDLVETWTKEGVIIGIGNNKVRKLISNRLINNTFETLVHPRSFVSHTAILGEGSAVMAGVSVNADVKIGKHVILNTNCSIDHDCVIQNFVHISPNTALAGNVTVGEGSHLGIGSCVIQGIKIGRWVTIGAGAVVIRDIPDFAVVVGNPARIIKYNKKNKDE